MLTFFRRIRKGLLDGGATRKYILYAIGEILLVMIGILLALQVNNWNEEQKTKIFEKNMLEKMQEALNHDLADLGSDIEMHRESLKSQELILRWLQSDRPYSDSLCYHFARSNSFTSFISDDSPFETLKIYGIDIISNDSLQKQISSLYEFRYDFLAEVEGVFNDFIKRMLILNAKYFSDPPWDINSTEFFGCMHPNSQEQIRNASDYEYHFKLCMELNKHKMNTMTATLSDLKDLIKMIDSELAK